MAAKKFIVSEILIIVGILMVVGLFIVPVSPALIDFLILLNIISTLVLISLVIYVDAPVKLTFFPSLLLILTLFRIGLSISTSRVILLDAHAGQFIDLAGKFLIGDNIVVGIIIFSIIAVVNFLVVTKGAERVAEVVARFTLDAMPGKQMSIDADLKAGNITMEQAQERRHLLQQESSLYGALDGATKFIKGDVISNIIIVIVNLIGGIIVGIYQKDYDLSQAVSTYSILSIGDGLLQQIPITLSSIAGGVIVTRINNEMGSGNIGQSVKNVLKDNSVVLLTAALALPFLLVSPNLPRVTVSIMLVALISAFIFIRYKFREDTMPNTVAKIGDFSEVTKEIKPEMEEEEHPSVDISSLPTIDPWKVYPIIVVLSKSLVKSKRNKTIKRVLESINSNLYLKLGVELPQIYITQGNIAEDTYQILINEVTVAESKIYDTHLLVPFDEAATLLKGYNMFKNEVNIGLLEYGYWVESNCINQLEKFNLTYLNHEKFLLEHATFVLINNISELIGFQEIKVMFDKMNEYQDLIKELLRMIPLNKITEVLKRLLMEKISIRNFKFILDALLEWAPKEKETILLVEYVRVALGRYIGQMFKVEGRIYAISIDGDTEETIMESIRYTNNGFYLDLMDSFYDDFNEKVGEILSSIKLKNRLVLITNLNVRKAVSHIVSKKYNMAVLSYEEVQNSGVPLEVMDFIYL